MPFSTTVETTTTALWISVSPNQFGIESRITTEKAVGLETVEAGYVLQLYIFQVHPLSNDAQLRVGFGSSLLLHAVFDEPTDQS